MLNIRGNLYPNNSKEPEGNLMKYLLESYCVFLNIPIAIGTGTIKA